MAVKALSKKIRELALKFVFVTDRVMTSALSIKVEAFYDDGETKVSVSDPVSIVFDDPVDNEIDILAPVAIDVDSAIVNHLKLRVLDYNDSAYLNQEFDLELEGNEIQDFTSNEEGGIYLINTCKIQM